MIHETASSLAGKTVAFKGHEYEVEDWWDRVAGVSWMHADGNPACLHYAMRSAGNTPIDNEVLYGKISGRGLLVHISEIQTEGKTE